MRRLRTPKSNGYEALRVLSRTVNSGRLNTTDVATAEYVPTQVIAEFFKQKGFDGVVYRSSLSDGYNLALFDLTCAEVIHCALHAVKAVKFEFKDAGIGYAVKAKPTA